MLKDCDAYLRFVFFTGVTKFSKVSIFSDLNQLKDISLDYNYDAICGITQKELEENFVPEIEAMAERMGFTEDECLAELKRMYDGYHFCMNCPDIYNPFSLLNAFSERRLGSYWFASGTPTFLIKKLEAINFNPRTFIETVKISEQEISDYRPENINPIPLFYQSGYLTIKTWNERQLSYKLGFPNDEVKYGFLTALAPSYAPRFTPQRDGPTALLRQTIMCMSLSSRGTDRRRMLFHRLTRRDMQLPTVPTAASFSKSE